MYHYVGRQEGARQAAEEPGRVRETAHQAQVRGHRHEESKGA